MRDHLRLWLHPVEQITQYDQRLTVTCCAGHCVRERIEGTSTARIHPGSNGATKIFEIPDVAICDKSNHPSTSFIG